MNKNELNNINEGLRIAAANYYHDNNYDIMKGIEIMCSSLNYLNSYYNIVNRTILQEMFNNKKINYTTLSIILLPVLFPKGKRNPRPTICSRNLLLLAVLRGIMV